MKRLGLIVSVICLAAAGLLGTARSSVGQTDSDDHVSALETQVADLEATIAALGGGSPVPPVATPDGNHALSVTIVITGEVGDAVELQGESACSAIGFLGDINKGLPVAIKDVTGKEVANTALGEGAWEAFGLGTYVDSHGVCTFEARPVSVAESPFFIVEVGDHLGFAFSLEEMEHSGWKVRLYATDFMDH